MSVANQRDLLSNIVARVWTPRDASERGMLLGHATWTGTYLLAWHESFKRSGASGAEKGEVFLIDFPGRDQSVLVSAQLDELNTEAGYVLLSRTDHVPAGLDIPFFLESPKVGDVCRMAFCPSREAHSRVENLSGTIWLVNGPMHRGDFSIRVRENLGGSLPEDVAGAPVLLNGALVGILTDKARRSNIPGVSFELDVQNLAGMAGSKAGASIRAIVRQARVKPSGIEDGTWIGPDFESGRSQVEEGGRRTPDDAEFWARLSPSSKGALERADLIRKALDQPEVQMEYLIYGLFEKIDGPTQVLFRKSKIDQRALNGILFPIISEEVGTAVFDQFRKLEAAGLPAAQRLGAMPPVSRHVRDALLAAFRRSEDRGEHEIRSRHLLYGALSVGQCRVIQLLAQRGVKKEDVVHDEWADPIPVSAGTSDVEAPIGAVRERDVSAASPTPKVDSDMWCEQDRLGYEAYARTIAALITHEETRAPLTIGVKAPWGAGKTSLMKRVQHLLDGQAYLTEENRSGGRQQASELRMTLRELLRELKRTTRAEQTGLRRKYDERQDLKLPSNSNPEGKSYELPPRVTVWFNAWKYQTSEQIWAGMAHCIISQVTARMTPKDRELFWLRLHARRVNADEVRRKIYEAVVRQVFPFALMMMVASAVVVWLLSSFPMIPLRYVWQGVTVLAGLFGVIWRAWNKLGDKAAGTVKELVREPDYEGKMGYLHLVESDIREVLNLVTAVQGEATTGAKIPSSAANDAAVGRSSTDGLAKVPLVVFVDDLDRCAPNKVAEVVEAINLFLCGDYPNCIFVLGMEPGMVAAALEVANKDVIAKAREMGVLDSTAPVGWRFLEKIVQLPVMIPPPTKQGRDTYVQSLVGLAPAALDAPELSAAGATVVHMPPTALRAEVTPLKEEVVKKYAQLMRGANLAEVERKSLQVVAGAPAEEKRAAAEAGKRVYAHAFNERDPMIANFVQECAELVDGNPRQIKRYVNVFRFYSTLRYALRADGFATAGELPSDKILAKFVSLSVQWPHAMDCLRGRHRVEEGGRALSRLEYLEGESAKITADDAEGDAAWKQIVGEKGMGLESWAHSRAFRTFLARGDSLGKSGGHGLW